MLAEIVKIWIYFSVNYGLTSGVFTTLGLNRRQRASPSLPTTCAGAARFERKQIAGVCFYVSIGLLVGRDSLVALCWLQVFC
jgi:hypothetical protein